MGTADTTNKAGGRLPGEPDYSAWAYVPFTSAWTERIGWELGKTVVNPSDPIDVMGFDQGVPKVLDPFVDEGKRLLGYAVVAGVVSIVVVGGVLIVLNKVAR